MLPLQGAFFEGVPPGMLDELRQAATPRTLLPGEALFREEDACTHLWAIASGRVRIWRTSPRGAAMIIHVLGPGDLPGCAALFAGMPYPASATAIDEVQALGWPAERARALLAANAVLAANALRIMAGRNEEMLQRLHDVSSQPVETRLARAVLRLVAERRGDDEARATVLGSRQELAELAATTLHTVSRIISRWERGGVVLGLRGRIDVLRPAELAKIAEGEN